MSISHTHSWTVESPNGPSSIGHCRCGATAEFPNSPDTKGWRTHINRQAQDHDERLRHAHEALQTAGR